MLDVFNTPPKGPQGMIELDPEQKEAVRRALYGKISVISGRPGSGKTSIVAGIMRTIARVGYPALESVALAAPTGKAADRMRQSITEHLAGIPSLSEEDQKLFAECPPSYTLHRLLGYSPGRDLFLHNENNPLSEQLVIIDESSMIDLAMMDRLLRALQPASRLILLGDADQLPSIEAGAVLRDICRTEPANELNRVTVLKKSYRAREEDPAGKSILDLAASVNNGSLNLEKSGQYTNIRREVSELRFEGVEFLLPGTAAQKLQFMERWLSLILNGLPDLEGLLREDFRSGPAGFEEESILKLHTIITHYEKFRVLCVTRVTAGGTGSEEVNAYFHARWSENRKEDFRYNRTPLYMIGEPVIVTKNDYNLNLYNGDSGLILKVLPFSGSKKLPAEPMAVFPRSGTFVAYPLEALRGRLELSWATTVHKAQGSEYDHIAILLPDVNVRPLNRELLYTAITRAKKSVSIIGSEEILKTGINRSIERASGLTDILSGGFVNE
ncbi:MAG: exodeoxyribonuclease V subunit alpha, partial [Dethiobacteria bacterium]